MKLVPAALTALVLWVQPAMAGTFSDAQKKELGEVIRSYLLENPDVLEEAFDALQKKKDQEKSALQATTLSEQKAAIFDSPHNVVLGNPKGKKVIVEFFDYNCGYCKRAMADMLTLIETDKDVKFILKEFPVLGQGSVEAAQVAAAVNRIAPDKYIDFHKKLMTSKSANKAAALEAATGVGVEAAKLTADMARPDANAGFQETFKIADALGINGTPGYIIGSAVVPGAIGVDRLKALLAGG